ncbi:MAG: biopolymer transporter ExbD [Bacteroidota bacterium]|nr:biopolymer transporter ExbD [Bacteroidota bacterium]
MSLRKSSKIKAEAGMSSMTDIVFLLLIFFILTSTVVREPVLKVLLPKGVKDQNQITKPVRMYLNAEGVYAIEKQKNIAFEDLPSVLQMELSKNPDAPVSINADKTVIYEKVMEMVSIANRSGAKVVLALDKESKK